MPCLRRGYFNWTPLQIDELAKSRSGCGWLACRHNRNAVVGPRRRHTDYATNAPNSARAGLFVPKRRGAASLAFSPHRRQGRTGIGEWPKDRLRPARRPTFLVVIAFHEQIGGLVGRCHRAAYGRHRVRNQQCRRLWLGLGGVTGDSPAALAHLRRARLARTAASLGWSKLAQPKAGKLLTMGKVRPTCAGFATDRRRGSKRVYALRWRAPI